MKKSNLRDGSGPKYAKKSKGYPKGEKGSKGFGLGVGPRAMHSAKKASSKMHSANSVGKD